MSHFEQSLESLGYPVTAETIVAWANLAGKAYVDAVHSDSYDDLRAYFAGPVAARIQHVDEAGAAHGWAPQPRFHASTCEPVALIDGHVRVRMRLWAVDASGAGYLWNREVWSIRLPTTDTKHVACAVCGAPYADSRGKCKFCSTLRPDNGTGFLVMSASVG